MHAREMYAANALGGFGDFLRWRNPQPLAPLRVLPRCGDRVQAEWYRTDTTGWEDRILQSHHVDRCNP